MGGTDNGLTGRPRDTIDTTQGNVRSDMEKVENVHAIDEGGTRGKRRLRDDIRKETVKDLENHTLANRDEQKTHTNLERGRGEGTPKRKIAEGGGLRAYESPAKKRNVRKDFNFEALRKFWTSAENTLKPSVPITDKSDNIGVRDTSQHCHNQGQPTESGENES